MAEGEGERNHRKYSPSQSEVFIRCPGAPNLLERTPSRRLQSYALEGTEAHTILEAGLKAGSRNAVDAISESIYCCESDRFGNELIASINEALDYVWDIMDRLDLLYGDAVLWVETYVEVPSEVAPGEAGGFVDIAIYSPSARWLWVIDYKHGEGVPRYVEFNTQLMQYGAGFLFEENARVDVNNVLGVTFVILQPRAFHDDGTIREFDTTPSVVWDYLQQMDKAIAICEQPEAPLIPGKEQCRFCRAKTTCPAIEAQFVGLAGENIRTIKQVNAKMLPLPSSLDGQRLGYICQMKPVMINWLNAVEEHAKELESIGLDVPGVKLVETTAIRKWHGDEKTTVKSLAALIGCTEDDVYLKSLPGVTLAEARIKEAFKSRASGEKKRKASADAKRMMAFLTTKESSGNLTLVPDDDPRPATNKALQAFDGLMGTFPTT